MDPGPGQLYSLTCSAGLATPAMVKPQEAAVGIPVLQYTLRSPFWYFRAANTALSVLHAHGSAFRLVRTGRCTQCMYL